MTMQQPVHPADNLNFQPSPFLKPRKFDGSWRMTECIGCPGAMLHRALGCPANTADGDTLNLFHEGYLHEADVKQRLLNAGYNFREVVTQQEPGIRDTEYPVYIHPDGFFDPDNEVVEIKSIGDVDEWAAIQDDIYTSIAPRQSWFRQVQGYMRVMQRRYNLPEIRSRIIPKDRKSGKVLKSIVINPDQQTQDSIWATIKSVVTLLKGKEYPFSGVDCGQISQWGIGCSSDYMTRLFCPYYGIHCHKDRQQVDQYLLVLLHEYAMTKVVYDRLEKDVGEYRAEISKVMDELNETNVKANGIQVVKFKQKGRLSFKEDDARRILTPEQFNELFTIGEEFSVTRITPGDDYRKFTEPLYDAFLKVVLLPLNKAIGP